MAGSKKDDKGRVLYTGECQRKNGSYAYCYTDTAGKRRFVYAPTLEELRQKEKEHQKDVLDGIDTYLAGEATLNFLFDRYISINLTAAQNRYTAAFHGLAETLTSFMLECKLL